jgi:transposase
MMGRKGLQAKWFYDFSLEQRVPQDHLLRLVANAIDFSFVRDLVRDTYGHTGAPSVDPVVVFKMGLLGYLYGITSERRLAEEIKLNLAYMWFLGYDLDEPPPDHSILSKARARYGPQAYRQFFSEVVRRCREVGLVDGDRIYLDATLVRANASLDSLVSRPLYQQLVDADEYVDRLWTENPSTEGRRSEPPQLPGSQSTGAKPGKLAARATNLSSLTT